MKWIKELLQTYVAISVGFCCVVIIVKVITGFLGTDVDNSLLRFPCNFADLALTPFNGAFISSTLDGSTINYNAMLGLVVYLAGGAFSFSLIKVAFLAGLKKKVLGGVNLLFTTLECIFGVRFVLELLGAGATTFTNSVVFFVNIFTFPIKPLTALVGQYTLEIETFGVMALVGIVWFTAYKFIGGISDSVVSTKSSLKKKNVKERVEKHKEKPLITNLDNVKDLSEDEKLQEARKVASVDAVKQKSGNGKLVEPSESVQTSVEKPLKEPVKGSMESQVIQGSKTAGAMAAAELNKNVKKIIATAPKAQKSKVVPDKKKESFVTRAQKALGSLIIPKSEYEDSPFVSDETVQAKKALSQTSPLS